MTTREEIIALVDKYVVGDELPSIEWETISSTNLFYSFRNKACMKEILYTKLNNKQILDMLEYAIYSQWYSYAQEILYKLSKQLPPIKEWYEFVIKVANGYSTPEFLELLLEENVPREYTFALLDYAEEVANIINKANKLYLERRIVYFNKVKGYKKLPVSKYESLIAGNYIIPHLTKYYVPGPVINDCLYSRLVDLDIEVIQDIINLFGAEFLTISQSILFTIIAIGNLDLLKLYLDNMDGNIKPCYYNDFLARSDEPEIDDMIDDYRVKYVL